MNASRQIAKEKAPHEMLGGRPSLQQGRRQRRQQPTPERRQPQERRPAILQAKGVLG